MPRRVLEGNVISDKADKTITVLVERRYMHPVYKKYIKSSDKYTAHDENNHYSQGDRVSIIECRPLSKRKRWTVVTAGEVKAPKEAVKPAAKKEVVKEATVKKSAAKKTTAKKKGA